MSGRRSLFFRLIVSFAAAQFIAMVFLTPFMEFFISVSGVSASWGIAPDDWGEYRLGALVRESLTRTKDGSVVLQASAGLRDYIEANPQARYAVFDIQTKQALTGSSPDLVTALGSLERIDASTIKFRISNDADRRARGKLRLVQTHVGPYAIAVYGYRFAWGDLSEAAKLFLTLHTAIVIAPGILGAVAIAWIVVRHGLAPLRAAAADIGSIDVHTVHRRISAQDAPTEVAPFIDAVNNALSRLDAGLAAQRRFTANAAHELRTPIAIMRAHADDPDDAAFRRNMKRDIRRLQTIVEQLLATARSSVHNEIGAEPMDLGANILTLIADYAPLMIENNRRIELAPPPTQIVAKVDKWALESVISNLLDNALRAEPEGGAIQVRVLPNAIIEVIDHGEGVAPSDVDRIFEPFWRRETRGKGAGLRLSISKSLVESMGGSLSIEETPGGGATFRIMLAHS